MPHRADLYTRLSYALAWIRGKTDVAPAAGLVLGSGLGGLADRLERAVAIPYQEIPSFPVSRVPGHEGRLVVGELAAPGGPIAVAAMQGRVHGYEGWSGEQVAFGTRVLCSLGVKVLLVTNAAGGVNPAYGPGDLVRIVDHLNLSGVNPLVGENDERLGPRFPDMSEAYDARLGALLDETAARLGVPLRARRVRLHAGPVVRDARRDPHAPGARRRSRRDVHGAGGDRRAAHGRPGGRSLRRHEPRRRASRGRPLSHEEVAETAGRVKDRLAAVVEGVPPRRGPLKRVARRC